MSFSLGFRKLQGTDLLPDICPACLDRETVRGRGVCEQCDALLHELPKPRCSLCGGAIDGVLDICGECLQDGERPWCRAVTVYPYGGFIRELIHRLKYGKAVYLAPVLGARMAAAWTAHGGSQPDVVTAVPMHWFRAVIRGYNQADLLAGEIARTLGISRAQMARRKRWSRKQVTLDRERRKKNLRGVFTAKRPEAIRGRHVLLVDDVFTTGSTLTAVADEIRKCEPAEVSVLTLARG